MDKKLKMVCSLPSLHVGPVNVVISQSQ